MSESKSHNQLFGEPVSEALRRLAVPKIQNPG